MRGGEPSRAKHDVGSVAALTTLRQSDSLLAIRTPPRFSDEQQVIAGAVLTVGSRKPSARERSKAMNEHIIRTLGYTAVFVVFVAAAGYFIATLPNEDQQKVTWVK